MREGVGTKVLLFSFGAFDTAYLAIMPQPDLQGDTNDASRTVDQNGGHFDQRAVFASSISLALYFVVAKMVLQHSAR
jgi:hypothetical protein